MTDRQWHAFHKSLTRRPLRGTETRYPEDDVIELRPGARLSTPRTEPEPDAPSPGRRAA